MKEGSIKRIQHNNGKQVINSHQTQPAEIQKNLQKRFSEFLSANNLQTLKKKFSEYYGKNFPISYKQRYGFQQQWQGFMHGDQHTQKYVAIQNTNTFYTAIVLAVMFFNTVVIWFNTFQTFFMEDKALGYSHSISIAGILIEIVYETIEICTKQRRVEQIISLRVVLSEADKSLIIIGYFVLKLIEANISVSNYVWYIIEAICIFLMYSKAKKIYKSLKLMDFVLMYEYQFKIIDIILNLIIIAHFIAIVLHQVTKLGFQSTWIASAGIEGETAVIRYAYSFYFCCTTILTVGYGDISPKNYAEVIVVTFVEIFGIIAFANFINQIGYSLTEIRKRNDTVEKELLIVQKMKKWYRMEQQLSKRARIHIVNNKIMDSQLSPEQQTSVMMKLSEQLRNQINTMNSLRKVKSSVFFLLRWSSSFQKAISLRLCNSIFPPGQLLYQPFGKQRIYIIRQGKIDIYASKRGSKRGICNKILKTIEADLGKQVSNNAYGFTAVISRRPVQLYAIAKRHTSGYYIEKDKFLECIHQTQTDFEYYHEFKNKIDLSRCWQQIQVPQLNSSKLHYNPTRAYIVKNSSKKGKYMQRRKQIVRGRRKISRLSFEEEIQGLEQLNADPTIQETFSDIQPTKKTIPQLKSQRIAIVQKINVNRNNIINHSFESSKDYSNYFPSNNRSQVLKKFDIELGVQRSIQEGVKNHFNVLRNYREAVWK